MWSAAFLFLELDFGSWKLGQDVSTTATVTEEQVLFMRVKGGSLEEKRKALVKELNEGLVGLGSIVIEIWT